MVEPITRTTALLAMLKVASPAKSAKPTGRSRRRLQARSTIHPANNAAPNRARGCVSPTRGTWPML